MLISSTRSTRFEADSSSYEIELCLRQFSNEGSVKNTESNPSSLITG